MENIKTLNQIFEELKAEAEKDDNEQSLWETAKKIYIQQIKDILQYLATHNKNYTKKQYYYILDLQELFQDLLED